MHIHMSITGCIICVIMIPGSLVIVGEGTVATGL